MAEKRNHFDPKRFLSTINGGRKIEAFAKKQTIFAQGDSCDAVFYIKEGKVKLTVVSEIGKEATIGITTPASIINFGSRRYSFIETSLQQKLFYTTKIVMKLHLPSGL